MVFIIIPLIAMIGSQLLKGAIAAVQGHFSWYEITGYGGMPSSHAALVTALAMTIARFEGVASVSFAVSFILLIIIVRDAMGFRYQIGIHGAILNRIIKELPDTAEYRYPVLNERLGHTPAEVLAGIVSGLVFTFLCLPFFV